MRRQAQIALTTLFLASCVVTGVSCGPTASYQLPDGPPQNPSQPGEKPTVPSEPSEVDAPIVYTWYYKGLIANDSQAPFPACPQDFEVDGVCTQKLEKCERGVAVYACYPKDLEIRMIGKVIDENGEPLRGAQIFSTYGHSVFPDFWVAESRASGNFVVKAGNGCYPLLSAAKDGYVSMKNDPQDTRVSKCKVENFEGSSGLVFQLKKAPRTVDVPAPAPVANQCEVTGRVVDQNGKGIEGAQVLNGQARAVTDSSGLYTIKVASSCDRFCIASKEGYRGVASYMGARALASCYSGAPADMVLVER